jgi:hypothetical protein
MITLQSNKVHKPGTGLRGRICVYNSLVNNWNLVADASRLFQLDLDLNGSISVGNTLPSISVVEIGHITIEKTLTFILDFTRRQYQIMYDRDVKLMWPMHGDIRALYITYTTLEHDVDVTLMAPLHSHPIPSSSVPASSN